MIERLSQFIQYQRVSVRAFEQSINASDGMIRRAIANKTDIQSKWLSIIAENYPNLSIDWLITGKGNMIKGKLSESAECDKNIDSISKTKVSDIPTANYEYKGAPYYNVDFIGGFDMVFNDQTRHPDYYINFAPYNKPGVIWCNITGHSMEPELNNGDFIAMKEMTDPIEYLPYGEIYGIVTDNYRTVKRIRMSDRKGFVRLIPTNKSPEYAEQEIPISMIRKVFAVLGSMHRLF